MNLTIRHVDTNHVQQVWPMVKPFLEEAMVKVATFPIGQKTIQLTTSKAS